MSNKVKDLSIKSHTYYFFDDIINIKHFIPNNINIDEKSCKNFLFHYIGYVTIKNSRFVKINSLKPLYLTFSRVNGYFKKINKIKHLMLVPTNENNKIIKEYQELPNKIRGLIKLITKNSKLKN